MASLPASAHRLPDGRWTIERAFGYWAPDETIPVSVARRVIPVVYVDLLGGEPISVEKARLLGHPLRVLGENEGWGQHWVFPADAVDRAGEILAHLADLDILPDRSAGRRSRTGPAVMLPTHRAGRRTWILCPEHDDHTPSALVNPSGVVYCFACAQTVGFADLKIGGVLFRPLLLSSSSSSSSDFSDLPVRKDPPPGEVTDTTGGGSLLESTRPTANAPYSLLAVELAGAPGKAPRHVPGTKPGGVIVVDEDRTWTVEPMARGVVLARRYGDKGCTKRSKTGFTRSYSSKRDLLDILRVAQRQNAGPAAAERAIVMASVVARWKAPDHREFLPDAYVSLDVHAHASTRTFRLSRSAREAYAIQPQDFKTIAGRWVGVDLDGFTAWPDDDVGLVEAAKVIAAMLERHPVFSGRCALVRTSHGGVQIVAELAEYRHDLAGFYADPHVRQMLANLDTLCLDAVREAGFEGGHADPTVHAPGRYIRRPGPRLTKQGIPYVAHLVWSTP